MITVLPKASLRVIKLGGSLLSLDDIAERFRTWHACQSPARDILIVGGGSAVEELRSAQQQRGIDDQAAHWMAIDLMSKNAARLAEQLDDFQLTRDLRSICEPNLLNHRWILDTADFLRSDHRSEALPANWDVTSDSIAARVAVCCGADELVLLKSALAEPNLTIEQLARAGYVDPYFVHATASLRAVSCVDLRTPNSTTSYWLCTGASRVPGPEQHQPLHFL